MGRGGHKAGQAEAKSRLGAGAQTRQMRGMSRPVLALIVGLLGFFGYVLVVLALADRLRGLHWTVELVFFAIAGIAWVWPAKRLMVWAYGGPGRG